MKSCPCCHELVEELTNYHCKSKHGMSRKELIETYGEPTGRKSISANKSNSIWNRAMDQR